ncbi:hypothetical protein L596_028090 [Steinernema carpocapsae]|uniref:Uncharacterized protein n=1 Tax=Steinernema carpocapsae TaxID=34508 RepID=A0A4U5LXF2_STECR|nr:hypothetical protein L596_028090 [Steinernema carpocapsae]
MIKIKQLGQVEFEAVMDMAQAFWPTISALGFQKLLKRFCRAPLTHDLRNLQHPTLEIIPKHSKSGAGFCRKDLALGLTFHRATQFHLAFSSALTKTRSLMSNKYDGTLQNSFK